jgi:hypothetical protein
MLNFPPVVFLFSLAVLWSAGRIGLHVHIRHPLKDEERDDFSVVQGATLTMLGLLIGFSFSMAISRYDLRKTYEEAEANAIGTEFVRADLLPPASSALKSDLKKYTDLRIAFYRTRDRQRVMQIDAETGMLQAAMWSTVSKQAQLQASPITALVVSGMNDVLNSQGYTQAAWWNRIPVAAWYLLAAIAICGNVLFGYGLRAIPNKNGLLIVLPLVVSISFFLIADIDSPRGGLIRVSPQNLVSLTKSMSL